MAVSFRAFSHDEFCVHLQSIHQITVTSPPRQNDLWSWNKLPPLSAFLAFRGLRRLERQSTTSELLSPRGDGLGWIPFHPGAVRWQWKHDWPGNWKQNRKNTGYVQPGKRSHVNIDTMVLYLHVLLSSNGVHCRSLSFAHFLNFTVTVRGVHNLGNVFISPKRP